MEPSATSSTVIGPVGQSLQAGTPGTVLNRPSTLRRLRDSGTAYKYPDLVTYLQMTDTHSCK